MSRYAGDLAGDERSWLMRVQWGAWILLRACAARDRLRSGIDHGRRQGLVGSRTAGRNSRSVQPGADREGPRGRHRRIGPVPHRRSAAGHLHRQLRVDRLQSVRREGIELPGTFTATVDAELRVGSIEETITVTGDSPIVDVQSIRRQTVLDNDVISSIPSSRSYNSLMQLMPNTVTQAGAAMDTQVVPGHGGLRRRRRPQQRRARERRRHQRRLRVQRRRRVVLHRRRRQRARGDDDHVGRARRSRGRRAGDEHRAQGGRQQRRAAASTPPASPRA